MIENKNWIVKMDHRAEKEFKSLPKKIRKRFYRAFELLELNPYKSRPECDIRVIKGGGGARAIRVGQYRGIYQILLGEKEVRFTTFAHRKSVYKKK